MSLRTLRIGHHLKDCALLGCDAI